MRTPLQKLKDQLIERLNHLLYGSRAQVMTVIGTIKVILWFGATFLLLYIFGWEPSTQALEKIFHALDIILIIYFLTFFIRWFYAFRRREFIKRNLLEAILVLILLVNGISHYLFHNLLLEGLIKEMGFNDYQTTYLAIITGYFMVLIIYEFSKASTALTQIQGQPARTFIFSFILLILVGSLLLMMPAMTVQKGGMHFLPAFFTSTSACCVTGLIVVDTATFFTFKGQIIIMILIQLGGLGILSFASFFATFLRSGVGLRHQMMIQDFLSSESLFSAKGLLRQIIGITFLIEFISFVLIFFTWGDGVTFDSLGQKVFFSMFHSISAFCNAGFSLFSNNLSEAGVRHAYILHIIVALTIIMGGLGFSTIQDLFSIKRLRERIQSPWKEWKIGTKIAVYMAIILLAFGTILIYLLEKDNTLKNMNVVEGLITAFFHSASSRTAGFNTVDVGQMRQPTLILLTFLMFVGASSGSVAGGIKTSTFYLLIASVIATLRGRLKIEIGRRFIPKELLFKALSIFFFAALLNLLAVFLLTITEPDIPLSKLMFEQISAFGTVGLSTGITSSLSDAGQVILIFSMFLGRVGTLTFAYAMSSRVASQSYKYPKAHLMVG